MNHAVERSISLYRQTTGPLRCLSDRDPCHLHDAVRAARQRKDTPSALSKAK